MQDIADRIRELIDYLGLSNKNFAESIDIAPAIISHVLSGRNNPSLHLIQQITNVYTNVNLSYLLNGEGDLIKTEADDQSKEVDQKEDQGANNETNSTLPPGARYVSAPSGAPIPARIPEDRDIHHTENKSFRQEEDPRNPEPSEPKDAAANDELTNVYTNVNSKNGKQVERIIVFYTDRSFREYYPEA